MVTPVPAASAGISKLGIKSQRFVAVAVVVVGSASEILPGTPDIPNPDDIFEIPPLTASVTELNVSVTAPVISVTTSPTAVAAAPMSLPNFVVPSSISLSKSKPLSPIAPPKSFFSSATFALKAAIPSAVVLSTSLIRLVISDCRLTGFASGKSTASSSSPA